MRQMIIYVTVIAAMLATCVSLKLNPKAGKPIVSNMIAKEVRNPVKALLLTSLLSFSLFGDISFETMSKSASSIAHADSTGKVNEIILY